VVLQTVIASRAKQSPTKKEIASAEGIPSEGKERLAMTPFLERKTNCNATKNRGKIFPLKDCFSRSSSGIAMTIYF